MKRERKGNKGHKRCRWVGGDRGHIRNNITGEEKEEWHLFEPQSVT